MSPEPDQMSDELHELTGVYVLGALRGDERARFEAHLATCERCQAEVRSFGPVVDSLSRAERVVEPPLALRARVLGAGTGEPRNLGTTTLKGRPTGGGPKQPWAEALASVSWLAAAASFVIAVGVGVYAAQLRVRIALLESQLDAANFRSSAAERQVAEANFRSSAAERQVAEAKQSSDRAQSMLAVLAAPDMARVDLKGTGVASAAAGRAFWSRARGLVFTATNLPPLPAGKIYQLWVVTPTAPVSAGLLRPDDQGRVTTMVPTDPLIAPVAMAVTLEPEGGVPSPTGDKYLIGLVAP